MLRDRMARRRASASAETSARLHRLEHELDQEHALQFGAAAIGVAGAVLGLAVNRSFVLLPALAIATLVQYLVQGWCPPLPLLARLGLRTRAEIEGERYALAAALDETREPHLAADIGAGAD